VDDDKLKGAIDAAIIILEDNIKEGMDVAEAAEASFEYACDLLGEESGQYAIEIEEALLSVCEKNVPKEEQEEISSLKSSLADCDYDTIKADILKEINSYEDEDDLIDFISEKYFIARDIAAEIVDGVLEEYYNSL
jgi:hypothetical protein